MIIVIPKFATGGKKLVTLRPWRKPSQVRTEMRALRAMTPAQRIALRRDPLTEAFFGPANQEHKEAA